MNTHHSFIIPAAAAILLCSTVARADSPTLRIDLGNRFEVRIQNSVNRDGKAPIGTSTFVLGFHVENAASDDSIKVTFAQGGKPVALATCTPKKPAYATRCESAPVPATSISTQKPMTVAFVHDDSATDAKTTLLALELAVLGTRDWVGNKGSRPQHVDHRHLRMDGASSLFLLEDSADAAHYTRKDEAYLRLWYWDAFTEERKGAFSMRCRVDGGDWTAYKMGRPSPSHGPQTVIENRVYDKKTRGAVTERLTYQRLAFNVNMPFSVAGARKLDEPRAVDGTWQCELRVDGDTGKKVVRAIQFTVADNVAQPHPAQAGVYLGPKRIAATVSLGDTSLPSFDPGQIDRPYGIAPAMTGLLPAPHPNKLVTPAFRK